MSGLAAKFGVVQLMAREIKKYWAEAPELCVSISLRAGAAKVVKCR